MGVIRGRVLDVAGMGVGGAFVEVEDRDAGVELRTTTERDGEFVVTRVPPGEYMVGVEARGFERVVVERVAVHVGEVTEVETRLKAGADVGRGGTERGSVPRDSSAAVRQVGRAKELERLPVNEGSWEALALLGSNANKDATGEELVSFRGLPATENSTQVDGGSDDVSFNATPLGAGGSTGSATEDELEGGFSSAAGRGRALEIGTGRRVGAASTFSREAVREFRVSEQNYSAVYGHGAGGVVSTVSKSGTNQVHGAGFYLARTSAWAATNPFSVATSYSDGRVTSGLVKPHDLRQEFGGSVGGAVRRDRLFYFYALDVLRRGYPAVSSPQYAGFYALTATQMGLLGNRGVLGAQVNAALNYLSSLTGTVARRQAQTISFLKGDWVPAERHRVSVEYNRARMDGPGGARAGAVVDRGVASMGNSFVDVDGVLGRWLWRWGARGSNEVRVQLGRDLQYETAQTPLPQEPAVGPDGFAPEVSIGPQGVIFGTPASLGRKAYPDERRVGVGDMATWARGRHLVQAGVEVDVVRDAVDSLTNVAGTFSYDSGSTKGKAGGLVDWITDYTFNVHAYPNGGCPSIVAAVHDFCFRSFTQSFGEQSVGFSTQEWAAFLEDGWRVRQGLNVKVGLRYEYELLPLPQRPNGALDAVFGARGATSVFPEDRNNLGLRVGAAWEPLGAGHGVVRVGYGQYFGRLAGATIRSALVDTAMADSTTHVRIVPTTVTYCPQVAGQGFGYVCSYVAAPPSAVAVTTSAMVFDRRFRLPAVQQGSLALEHGVGLGVVASAMYLMNLDRQLPDSVDINIAPSTRTGVFQISGEPGVAGVQDGYTFQVPVYTQRVSTVFGPVTDIVSNANATYHAMVLEARRRGRRGLELRVGWTWSKAIDFGQSGGAVPRTNGQFDPFDVRYDKGLSSFGHSHRVVASAVWEPRVEAGRRWVLRAANGWVVAPLFTATSGRPYSYDIFGGTELSGGRESINGSGGAVYLPTVGRNTLRLPETVNLDLRVARGVRVSDRVMVRGFAEAFNLGNRVNYSGVTQRAFLVGTAVNGVTPLVFQDAAAVAAEGLNARAFGTYTASGIDESRERQVQAGLRVEF